jgi:group I intron endonuclease
MGERMIDKRKLKEQYKQTLLPMGVYQIKNLANGKILVGSSKNLPGKINSHRFQLNMGSHMNKALQKEFTYFGKENFTFQVLDNLDPKDDPSYDYSMDLDILEKMWIERLQPFGERGYHNKPDESL